MAEVAKIGDWRKERRLMAVRSHCMAMFLIATTVVIFFTIIFILIIAASPLTPAQCAAGIILLAFACLGAFIALAAALLPQIFSLKRDCLDVKCFCPHCQKYVPTRFVTWWCECGHHENPPPDGWDRFLHPSRQFPLHCIHCGKMPQHFICPHQGCEQPILFGDDEQADVKNASRFRLEPPTPTEPVSIRRQAEKEDILHSIEIAELKASLARKLAEQRIAEGRKKSPSEELGERFNAALGAKIAANEALSEWNSKYAGNEEMLGLGRKIIVEFCEDHSIR